MQLPRIVAALVAATVLAACGGAVDGSATSTAESSASTGPVADEPGGPSPTAPPTPGVGATAGNAEALAFTAPALDGGQVVGTDYAGGDVVLWMWAPW